VSPPFVDSHFHLDSALTLQQGFVNHSGTLSEGIAIWERIKPELTSDDIKARALEVCKWAIARGVLAIRSHVDICEQHLIGVQALLEVREQVKPYLDIQLIAFPQDGYLRCPNAIPNLERALDLGVDVVGGSPHLEKTHSDGTTSIGLLCEIAEKRGLLLDMHCDETDDPQSRHIETLTLETLRRGLQSRVTGSHLTSMHSMDDDYANSLISLMAKAQINVVANPLINITLQGRADTYPKRRGLTRVKELLANGVNVSFGHDCIMDPWYSLGSYDMLEVASMALHVAQMTGSEQMHLMFEAVTTHGAKTLGLGGYGLDKGCNADLVILQAHNTIDALRLKPARLYVIRRGQIIAQTPPTISQIHIDGHTSDVDFCTAIL
jgi:cytosine deaminase